MWALLILDYMNILLQLLNLSTISLNTNAGIELTFSGNIDNAFRFSPNGKRLFVVTHDLATKGH